MSEFDEIQATIDDRLERLMSRSLDGEATAAEQAELEAVLATDSQARALWAEYQAIDASTGAVLRLDFESAESAVATRPRRGLWLATAGVVMGAAAVLAFSFVSELFTGGSVSPIDRPAMARQKSPSPVIGSPQFIDYNPAGDMLLDRQRDLHRDLIGIPGPNPNTIYFLERNVRSTRVAPIARDL